MAKKSFTVKPIVATGDTETLDLPEKAIEHVDNSPLSVSEQDEFERLEGIINAGLETFREVGNALIQIRDKRLYRQNYKTFEAYMQERFQLERRRGYQLMKAAQTVNQLQIELTIPDPSTDLGEAGNEPSLDPNASIEAVPLGKKRLASTKKNKSTGQPNPVDVAFTETIDNQSQDDLDQLTDTENESSVTDNQIGLAAEPTMDEVASSTSESNSDTFQDGEEIPLGLFATSSPLSDSIITELPKTESHALALSEIEPDKRTDVWKEVVNEAVQTGKPITAKQIKEKKKGATGVPLNSKPPKDRKPSKNAFGRNPDPDDEFSDDQIDLTRNAMKNTGISFLAEKLQEADIDQIHLIITGKFLLDQNLDGIWMEIRQIENPITEDFVDRLSLQEAIRLKLFTSAH